MDARKLDSNMKITIYSNNDCAWCMLPSANTLWARCVDDLVELLDDVYGSVSVENGETSLKYNREDE